MLFICSILGFLLNLFFNYLGKNYSSALRNHRIFRVVPTSILISIVIFSLADSVPNFFAKHFQLPFRSEKLPKSIWVPEPFRSAVILEVKDTFDCLNNFLIFINYSFFANWY